jgi:hypothetical protein
LRKKETNDGDEHDTANEEKVLFFVKSAEQVKRPADMLAFLGVYFKKMIQAIRDVTM